MAALPPEVPPGAARRPLLSEPACGLTPVGPADRPDRTHPRARSSTTSARRVVVRVDDRLGAGERIELGLLFGPRADPDRRPRVEPVTRPWAELHLDPAVLFELAVERPPTLAVLVGLLLQLHDEPAFRCASSASTRRTCRGAIQVLAEDPGRPRSGRPSEVGERRSQPPTAPIGGAVDAPTSWRASFVISARCRRASPQAGSSSTTRYAPRAFRTSGSASTGSAPGRNPKTHRRESVATAAGRRSFPSTIASSGRRADHQGDRGCPPRRREARFPG